MSVLFPPLLWLYVQVLIGLPDFLEAFLWLLIPSQLCPEKNWVSQVLSMMTQFKLRQRLLSGQTVPSVLYFGTLLPLFPVLGALCCKCPSVEADALFQHSQPAVQGRLRSSLLVCVWLSLSWVELRSGPATWMGQAETPSRLQTERRRNQNADRSKKEGPDDFVLPSSVPYCVLRVFSMSYP